MDDKTKEILEKFKSEPISTLMENGKRIYSIDQARQQLHDLLVGELPEGREVSSDFTDPDTDRWDFGRNQYRTEVLAMLLKVVKGEG